MRSNNPKILPAYTYKHFDFFMNSTSFFEFVIAKYPLKFRQKSSLYFSIL